VNELRIDWRAVNAIAREHWGVRWPIDGHRRARRIDPRTGLASVRQGRAGRHTVTGPHGGPYRHDIQLTSLPSELPGADAEMLMTLAHELEHARQSETLGVNVMSLLYSNFGPACKRLGFKRRRGALRHHEALEATATAAEDRWELLLPATNRRRCP